MAAPTDLVEVRPGVVLAADAGASFSRVEANAGRQVDVNSAYRDWDEQYQLWLDYQNGVPGAPYALHPDESKHCQGVAVDSDDQSIMKSAGEYGWRQTALAVGEPWHFDYVREYDKHFGEPAGGDVQPFPPATTEDEGMDYIRIKGKSGVRRGGTYAVFSDGGGKYSAVFIGSGGPSNLNEVTSEDQIKQLSARIKGLA